jgi:hypothetical protein
MSYELYGTTEIIRVWNEEQVVRWHNNPGSWIPAHPDFDGKNPS